MKKVLLYIVAVIFSVNYLFAEGINSKVNVMSYNIRYDNSGDVDNQWKHRRDFAGNLVKFHDVDVFGAQEVLHNQLLDLINRLPEFAYVGVGREDGKTKGEYSPIFYRKDRFVVEKNGNFWLAEDITAVGKKGWDAACERVATWAILLDKQTGKRIFFLNTHLDHMGQIARHEGAVLVLEQTGKLSEGLPVIVTGDFNAISSDEPIKVLTNVNDPKSLIHTRTVAEFKYGPEWTFHDFGKIPYDKREWIDYIFIKGPIKVLSHAVLTETLNRVFPSDHCPVISRLIIQ